MLQRISMFYFFFLIVWTVNVRSGKKGTFFRRCNKEFTLLYWNILRWCLVLLGDFGAQSPKILQKGRNLFFLVRKQAELLKESPVVIFQEVTFLWFCLHVSSPVTTWAWYTVFWDHLNIWYVLIWRQIFFPVVFHLFVFGFFCCGKSGWKFICGSVFSPGFLYASIIILSVKVDFHLHISLIFTD